VGDGYIFQGDVELLRTLQQIASNSIGDGLSLGDELGGVELGDDGFEDFVSDGGQDSFVVVLTQILPIHG
jgi:hypothetical protein